MNATWRVSGDACTGRCALVAGPVRRDGDQVDGPVDQRSNLAASDPEPPLRDPVERVLVGAELILAIGAIGGAIALVTGAIDLESAVEDLPWRSSVFAGVALFVLNALVPLAVVIGTWRRARWAPVGHVVVGVVLVGWIVVQVAFIGLGSWLQVAYAVLGVVIAVLGLRLLSRRPGGRGRGAHEGRGPVRRSR